MKYCTITPDRGDRPKLIEFCYKQITRMIDERSRTNLYIEYAPTSDKIDLINRVRTGVNVAYRTYNGIDWSFIIENDDYYPADYIKNLLPLLDGLDFIGWQNTFYYNIKTRRYSRLEHETHSSLFCTGFRLSALDDFEWPPDDYPFLDIALWKHAKQSGKNWKLLRTDNPCVGIKGHGMGKMGGKGHKMELMRADPDMKWFRDKLNDEEAFKFYQSIV
jgi:hypothetical protein